RSAVGILLLILALLLAYAGFGRRSRAQLFSTVCLTVSSLWFSLGLVFILTQQNELSFLSPGLAAFSLGLFLIGFVAFLAKKVILTIISISISLACAHQIAGLSVPGFGRTSVAAFYLLVVLAGVYFGVDRLLSFITGGKGKFPGAGLKDASVVVKSERGLSGSDVTVVGLVLNLVSAAVLSGPVVGLELHPALICWSWTAALFQSGVCVLLFRAMDPLAALFFAFMALLRFAEGFLILSGEPLSVSPVLCSAAASVLFFILALFSCSKSLFHGFYSLFFTVYCITIAARSSKAAQGVQVAIIIVTAGMILMESFNMTPCFKIHKKQGYFKSLLNRVKCVTLKANDKHQNAPHLGFSKYADAEVLGHACSVLAAFALLDGHISSAYLLLLPVVVGVGLLQLLCGSVAFSRGKTFESTVFFLYAVLWLFWGLVRYSDLYRDVRGFNVAVGIVSLLLFNSLVTVAALFLSVAWFAYTLSFQFIILSFLLDALGFLPFGYDIAASVVFGLVSLYCFLAQMFSSTLESPQIPLGKPIAKLSGVGGGADVCPHVPARKATSVERIADIMKNGGVCGMPTDTVYVLVAACSRPDAVVKAYKVKKQAEDRPMSMWISSIKQLEPVRHLLSPLLVDFMEAAWPSSISMVIPRGPWMDVFGLGDAAKHIGTPQSIAIRNPDCAVATHLMNLVGPIAVTSANPTGEADTTHHNQVYAKLGNKVDGVLCDGPSPENIASTVVDCTKIESGQIGFFRVGLIPKSKVLQIFEDVQKRHKRGQTNPAFDYDVHLPETGQFCRESGDSSAESGRGSDCSCPYASGQGSEDCAPYASGQGSEYCAPYASGQGSEYCAPYASGQGSEYCAPYASGQGSEDCAPYASGQGSEDFHMDF
uniref:Threonylcarbamoyl-AMP synthase n=1 Tax=Periophthalmus magnuspinnatus TaxID=409849 RepID=A0A3B3ZAN5_9GOBI